MTVNRSQHKAVKVAGLSYILIIVFSMLKLMLGSNLIIAGSDEATANNIKAHELLFRIGVATDITVFVLVVLLSVTLYIILRPVNKNLALFALFMRVGEGIIGGVVTLLSGLIPLQLLSSKTVFETEQLQALVGLFLDVQTAGLDIVLIFMGVGGTVYFYLFFKSKYVPRILAVWGIFTYLTMLILSFVGILLPHIPEMIAIVLFTPGALFELIFGTWLLFKGINVEQWENRPLESS